MQQVLRLSSAVLALGMCIHTARADEPRLENAASTYPDALWLTGSGALLGASLAGMFALKSEALHDRAASVLTDSAELPGLERDARAAARCALGFGVGAALFTAASLVLLAQGPSLFAAPGGSLTPVAGLGSAGLSWQGRLP